ncbi:hypothetical protein SAMN05444170_1295 [Bradyrhizobium erythrophlei]|uniref:Uncharacterized protein n=1 Tax=Bradyrhizobium erythrophlei TaxID=1437360 RepID=A0A1M7TBR7_9BRAD|nr:hypothetical protein SAMN05444170_1295 [Bradyrhizobium erythrophlei]
MFAEMPLDNRRVNPFEGSVAFRPPSAASARFPKFVLRLSGTFHELRKVTGTSKFMVLVPLFHLKFLREFAACAAGTSNGRD